MQLTITVVDPAGSAAPVDIELTAARGTAFGAVSRALLDALGQPAGPPAGLFLGDRLLDPALVLGVPPLLHGAVLTTGRPRLLPAPGLLELHALAGPDSGAVHHLVPGEHCIGRSIQAEVRLDDPDMSRLHAVLRVSPGATVGTTVHDLSSTNGTYVDDRPVGREGCSLSPGQVLRLGSTRLGLVLPSLPAFPCRPDGAGHLEVNRPPRHLPVRELLRVTMPAEQPARERGRFPFVAVLVPLVAGVALTMVMRSAAYLVFILLSPLLALGSFVSDRVGAKRSLREQRTAHAAEIAAINATVADAVDGESADRHDRHPGPSALLLDAQGPRPRLWERRCHDPDWLELRLGLGEVASQVEVRRPGGPGVTEQVDRPVMTGVPVTVSLARVGVLGLAGGRAAVLPIVRFLVAQLVSRHSPRHLNLVVLTAEGSADWEWVRWLPHLRSGTDVLVGQVGHDPSTRRRRVDELLALVDARTSLARSPGTQLWVGPSTVVVLDGGASLRREPGLTRLLEEGPAVGVYLLCMDVDHVSLPVECRCTAEVTGPTGTRLVITGADHDPSRHGPQSSQVPIGDVAADGVGDGWVARFARSLAPLRDATPVDGAASLPDAARLLDLLPIDATDAASLRVGWQRCSRSTQIALGVGQDGDPFVVDLARDGPHTLVAGTTGSGKSELLQTLVAALAIVNRPDQMSFVLVDYKGGAAFKDCARLPHTVGVVTDLDQQLTERALLSLGAELRRRESALLAAGCKDIEAYVDESPLGSPVLPRLVLVVDEFATLAEELPDFVGGLVAIAQRGRSLGVHLVLATQRPGGVVSADIRANTGLRIALRVTDPAESTDVVDVRDAADIDRALPGRAVVRRGTQAVCALQTARVSGRARHAEAIEVTPIPWTLAGTRLPTADVAAASGPTDLARIVDAAVTAAIDLGITPTPSPWLGPLPSTLTLDELTGPVPALDALTGSAVHPSAVAIGVIDLPSLQRQDQLTFDLDSGHHLLVAGSPRSGRSTLLRTVAAALAGRFAADEVHLFALDGGGGGLHRLVDLPHCGAVVARDDTTRGSRLLVRLAEEVRRRQRALVAAGCGSQADQRREAHPDGRLPWLVLLVDNWESLAAAYDRLDHGQVLETMHQLLREGAAVGLRVVLTGDRGVLTGRISSAFGERIVLRMADPVDYGLAGLSPRQVPTQMPAGRALVGPQGQLAQVAQAADPSAASAASARRGHAHVGHAGHGHTIAVSRLPMRVDALPDEILLEHISAVAKTAATSPWWTLVGVGGDLLAPVGVDLRSDGPAFVVAGSPGSGRSTALATMVIWLLEQGRRVVVIAPARSPLWALDGAPGVLGVISAPDDAALQEHLRACPDLVVAVDDVETLQDSPVEHVLLTLLRPDAPGATAVLLTGTTAEMAASFRGVTVAARRGGAGLLLGAVGPADGDLLGVRVARCESTWPGRGTLVLRGRTMAVQVARPSGWMEP